MDKPQASPERIKYLKKKKRTKRSILFWQIGILIFFIGLWEISASLGWVDSFSIAGSMIAGMTAAVIVGLI